MDIAFAGSWYREKHEKRRNSLPILLNASKKWKLYIFDRHHSLNKEKYQFPDDFYDFTYPQIDYLDLITLHKKFKIFLNTNSVSDSSTMFSRRVFEVLASSTPIVSTPSKGIDELFNGIVPTVTDEKECEEVLNKLMGDHSYRKKIGHKGYREVLINHTYGERTKQILEKIDLLNKSGSFDSTPKVSIVLSTNRPSFVENIKKNFSRQVYKNIEFILILNNDSFEIDKISANFSDFENIKIFQIPQDKCLGQCLNYAIEKMTGDILLKMDDDDIYLENYTSDIILPFIYSDAEVIGKSTYFGYSEELDTLFLRSPGKEHRYTNFIAGPTFCVKKDVFNKLLFPEVHGSGTDTQFLIKCKAAGIKIYSTDCYNFVQIRRTDASSHLWKMSTSEYISRCENVSKGLNLDIVRC